MKNTDFKEMDKFETDLSELHKAVLTLQEQTRKLHSDVKFVMSSLWAFTDEAIGARVEAEKINQGRDDYP